MELNFILALCFTFAFAMLIAWFGMPSEYQLVSTFDFLWLGGGIVAITTGCVVLTGIPCAILEASYGAATLFTYAGVPVLTNTATLEQLLKGLIFTPLTIGLIYVISKLARGGG